MNGICVNKDAAESEYSSYSSRHDETDEAHQQIKGRILIVEDYQPIAETYKLMLQAQGYDVVMSSNGQECIDKFEESCQRDIESRDTCPFDLVIVDYHIPNRDGIEVIEHVLSAPPRQRILIASSYPENVIRKSAEALQRAVELLQKPFDLIDLVETIEGQRTPEIVGGPVCRNPI